MVLCIRNSSSQRCETLLPAGESLSIHGAFRRCNTLRITKKINVKMQMNEDTGGVAQQKTKLVPVILIPGAGGNQLEARLTAEYLPPSWICRCDPFALRSITKRSEIRELEEIEDGFSRLWLSVPGILPPFTSCFADRIRLLYNSDNGIAENAPGVETRVPYFGSTEGMKYLDPSFRRLSVYMAVLIEALEAEGYVDGESIFGAPYDFRYAPGKHASHVASSFLRDLKGLIEIAYMNNGKQPVIILSHSLGGLWALHFLRQQSLTWQQEYIGHFIAVSTPWGGTVQSMKIFASGYAEGAPFINPLLLRAEQRSSESNLWLLPTPATFDKQVLVTTERDSYSACDISRFLEDVGYPEGVPLYESRIPALVESLNPPFIPVTIVYSDGIDTPLMLAYGRKGFEHQPLVTYGDGDGTVNLQSLMGVLNRWKALQGEDLEVINLHGKTHSTILTDKQAVNTLVEIVLSKPRHAEILS